MKLTSKEVIILSVFLSVVIIVASLFLFILPEYEKIDINKQDLENAKTQRDQIYETLGRESTIDQEVQDAIDRANNLSLCFYDDMTPYEADVIVREILAATNMKTYSLSLSNFSTATLTVSDFVETVVSYPLKEYAGVAASAAGIEDSSVQYDENGNIIIPDEFVEEDLVAALKNYLLAILSTQSQTIGAISVSFTVEGTRGDFLNFLNYVAALERATIINSTSVAYTGTATETTPTTPPAGEGEEGEEGAGDANNAGANTGNNGNNDPAQLTANSNISASISMTFYCITPMSNLEDNTDTDAGSEADAAA